MARNRQLIVSRAQVQYLRELIEDDIDLTDLSNDEREQADSLLFRLDDLEKTYEDAGTL